MGARRLRPRLGWLGALELVFGPWGIAHVWFPILFAPPLFLLSVRYAERPEPGAGVLLSGMVAGALSTKYTTVIVCAVPVAVVAIVAVSEVVRTRRLECLRAPACALASVVVLTAPVGLKNALCYGDPLYPMLRRFVAARHGHRALKRRT